MTDTIKLDVWTAAADDKNGTDGAAFATEREAYDWILKRIEQSREAFEASDMDCIWEFIEEHKYDLGTYNVDICEVAFPVHVLAGKVVAHHRSKGSDAIPEPQVFLTTVIRKGWEPRLSWAQSKSDMIEDLYQYATEVLELDVPAGASLEDIEAALDAKGQNLYWEQVQ